MPRGLVIAMRRRRGLQRQRGQPVQFSSASRWPTCTLVAAGVCHALLLMSTGMVVSYGDKEVGQCGLAALLALQIYTQVANGVVTKPCLLCARAVRAGRDELEQVPHAVRAASI